VNERLSVDRQNVTISKGVVNVLQVLNYFTNQNDVAYWCVCFSPVGGGEMIVPQVIDSPAPTCFDIPMAFVAFDLFWINRLLAPISPFVLSAGNCTEVMIEIRDLFEV
jgi:hypothetical protein